MKKKSRSSLSRSAKRAKNSAQRQPVRSQAALQQIPVSVLREHNGKWIVWDQEEGRLVGVGDTFEAAEEQADRIGNGHLLRFHLASWTSDVPSQPESR